MYFCPRPTLHDGKSPEHNFIVIVCPVDIISYELNYLYFSWNVVSFIYFDIFINKTLDFDVYMLKPEVTQPEQSLYIQCHRTVIMIKKK